jgi:hypothetical protein
MNHDEKLAALKLRIAPEPASDDLLSELLNQAGAIVLNRRFPFGFPVDAEVPHQYERIQISIALELFSKMGAEGETSHNENGISRTYEAGDISPSLMRQIMPMCAGVTINANP